MTNLKQIKRALFSSVIALFLCFAMLLGTTFAWFTDTVTSTGNKIVAGTLDVELRLWTGTGASDYVNISESPNPIFGAADSLTANGDSSNTLWEPGKTQTVYLSIVNNGTLDLKYKVAIEVLNVEKNLTEVMEYIITPDAVYGDITSRDSLDWDNGNSVVGGINEVPGEGELKTGEEHFFALSIHMDELAGNEYMNGSISFDIKVLAGQLASELDSFGPDYDADAEYGDTGANTIDIPTNPSEFPAAGFHMEDFSDDTREFGGTVVVPTEAIDPNATKLGFSAPLSDYTNANIVINTGYESIAYDVKVSGLKSDNDVPVQVQLRIPAGLDPDTVTLYHYGEGMANFVYQPESGLVLFETATFSPFTLVFDPNSTFEVGTFDPTALPEASVTARPDYVNTELEWGSYGQWFPTEGLDSMLECAYTFTALHNLDEAKLSDYSEWYCDFYVVLDRDLGENELFLGGNYGSFGWVGFHNGDVTLEANTELGLLESVTSNPWTYSMVVESVREFTCGVGDVNDALSGATFKVMLRLTNPENANEFYNVETIEFTFE